MKQIYLYSLILFFIVTIFLSCKGPTGPEGLQGQAGPKLKGNIQGFVTLVNSDGSQPIDRSGISVSIDSSSISTITGADGKFILSDLETGIYTINYSKSSYGSSKIVQYQFVGGGTVTLERVYLCQPPNFTVTIDSIKWMDGLEFGIYTTLSEHISGWRWVIFFIGQSPNVSSNPVYYLNTSDGYESYFNNGQGMQKTSSSWFMGFVSGDTAYIKAYSANKSEINSGYIDINTGRFVYTNLNPISSNVISVIIP